MKRAATLFLAALMTLSLAACGDNGDTSTVEDSRSQSPSKTTAPKNSSDKGNGGTPAKTTDATTEAAAPPPLEENEDLILVPVDATYKYKTFECVYNGSGAGGSYETDALKDFMDSYGWDMGAAEIPDSAKTAIDEFTDSAAGPFGYSMDGSFDINGVYDKDGNPLSNNPDVDWTGDNHGLICSVTFEIENLEEFKQKYDDLYLYFWYDNTPSVYLNGRLVFYYNTELTGNPGDWVDTPTVVDAALMEDLGDQTMMDLLVEGTNTVVIVLKDAWGGRECAFELDAQAALG